jgi:hypothetical protein
MSFFISSDVNRFIKDTRNGGISRLKKKLKSLSTSQYAVKLYSGIILNWEAGIITKKEGGKFVFETKTNKHEFTLDSIETDEYVILDIDSIRYINSIIVNNWTSFGTTKFSTSVDLLSHPEKGLSRVIVVIPVLLSELETSMAIANSVIDSIKERAHVSILMVESEPLTTSKKDDVLVSCLNAGSEIAIDIFKKTKDSDSIYRSIIIPTYDAFEGGFSYDDLQKMLYDTVINKTQTGAWKYFSENEEPSFYLDLAGYSKTPKLYKLQAIGEILDVEGIKCVVSRIKMFSGNSIPKNVIPFFSNTDEIYRIGDVPSGKLKTIQDTLIKGKSKEKQLRIKKLIKKIPYNIDCNSNYYKKMLFHYSKKLLIQI